MKTYQHNPPSPMHTLSTQNNSTPSCSIPGIFMMPPCVESLTLTQPRCCPFRLSQSLRTRLALCLSCSLSALPNTPSKGIPHLISRLQAAVTALFTSYPATFLSQNPLCVWICLIPLFPHSQAQP